LRHEGYRKAEILDGVEFSALRPFSLCPEKRPLSAFRRILVGYLNEFSGEKSLPVPEYSPFLLTALTKAHCEGIEVAQDSLNFYNSRKTQHLKKDAVARTGVKVCRDYSPISKSVAASEAMK